MLKFFIKLFISFAILAVLAYNADIESFKHSLSEISYKVIVYALGLILLIRLIMAIRWKILLGYYHINAPMMKLIEIIFVSNAVGHLLPSGIGTDIVRTYSLAKEEGNSEKVLASVFLDRVFGLISMIALALASSWYGFITGKISSDIALLLTLIAIVFFTAFAILRLFMARGLNTDKNWKYLVKIAGFYNKFISSLKAVEVPASGILALMFLSLLVQFVRCLVFVSIFMGMGVDIEFVQYLIFIPVVFILMLIPVSVGGLGVRESALYAFFGPLGLSVATCTAAGLVFHALQLLMIVPGIIIFNLKK